MNGAGSLLSVLRRPFDVHVMRSAFTVKRAVGGPCSPD